MTEIEFTHFRPNLDLKPFERQFHTQVNNRAMTMADAWAELLQVALHMEGPDVSEVGMTWLGSLSGMQVLRPFTPQELRSIRGQANFLEFPWQNCQYDNDTIAIPWHLDTRLFYYRRDILEKVGIDETTAFASPEQIEETLQRLKASGYELPWVVPTRDYVLQYLAPWVWQTGSAFRSADGRLITLAEPEALKGLQAYFRLIRLMPSYISNKRDFEINTFFLSGEAPIIYCGDWFYRDILNNKPDWFEAIGAAMVPGLPYVGAMYLVNWRHSIYENRCVDLIRYLTSLETMRVFAQSLRLIPPQVELLTAPPFTTDPIYQVISQSIQKGRTFKNLFRWAAVESRLNSVFTQLIGDVLNKPDLDLAVELSSRMNGVKQKLERTILT